MTFSRALAISAAVIAAFMFGATESRAQTSMNVGGIQYRAAFGYGFATDEQVARALGRLTFSVTDCRHIGIGNIARGVRVVSEKSEYDNALVVESVLRRAVEFAWQACPLRFIFGVRETSELRLDVGSVELYLPNGMLAIRAHSFRGDSAFHPGSSYAWQAVENVGAEQRAREAAAAVEREREAQRQAWLRQQQKESEEFWASVQDFLQMMGYLAVLLVAVIVFVKIREPILRWYYFTFHPHPVEPIVRSALNLDHMLDGNALAAALREVPPNNRILREVRIVQGERLVARMKRVSERLIREDLARARTDYERAAFISIQEAIGLAAVALERAKAAHEASRSVREKAA